MITGTSALSYGVGLVATWSRRGHRKI